MISSKWGRRAILGCAVLFSGAYLSLQNKSIRNICNVCYAGGSMMYIYKYTNDNDNVKNLKASQYLRDALKSNGGLYIKLGQLIASLDVIVPDQYRRTMLTLTRECPVTPFQDVKRTIQEQLKQPLNLVFSSFEEKPISSASVGQVHRATLLSGKDAAVKIQHRGLAERVESDLHVMRTFVKVAKYFFQGFKYEWLYEQFEKNIRIELDFTQEASNMKRFCKFIKRNHYKNIYTPELYLSPTKKLLVMQFIDGAHIDQIDKLKRMGINLKTIGKTFSHMIIKMIHQQGFVHADTHSGNLLVRKKGNQDQLVVIDHGLYQELDENLRVNYNKFWLGLILNDPSIYYHAARVLGTSNPKLLCSMLTSKTDEELSDADRNLFDLNPSSDRQKILEHASKRHFQIVAVLAELNRDVLLLLKVNQFARTIENLMEGRQMGVYEDIARECVNNVNASWWQRQKYYFRMWKARK